MELNAESFDEDSLFNAELLKRISWKEQSKSNVNPSQLGDDFELRPLHRGDYEKGFTYLLSQLTTVGAISKEQFIKQFNRMKATKCYFVIVIEDKSISKVVGVVTLLIEYKFIHGCALKGYLEDAVVSDEYRGKQLGKLLLECATILAKELGTYKAILNCKDNLITYYEKFGYVKEEGNANMMTRRFNVLYN